MLEETGCGHAAHRVLPRECSGGTAITQLCQAQVLSHKRPEGQRVLATQDGLQVDRLPFIIVLFTKKKKFLEKETFMGPNNIYFINNYIILFFLKTEVNVVFSCF